MTTPTTRSKRSTSRKPPKWLADYFNASLDGHEGLMNILDISASGISAIPHIPKAIEVLGKVDITDERHEERLKQAQRRAALAKAEIDAGFPTLNGFGVLALWSWAESFASDFAVLWISHRPKCLLDLQSTKIRVELNDFIKLKGRERARFIVDRIDREANGPMKRGLGRLNTVLSAIGFDVTLSNEIQRDIFEFQQIRNCLAHRFGIVDGRLASQCPWLELKEGDRLNVTVSMVKRYGDASASFLLELLYIAGDKCKINFRDNGN